MILLDYSSVSMSSLMPQINQFEQQMDLVRHIILNIIRKYNLQFRDEYGEMILCMDGGKNWRREQYPFYKASRRKKRDESKHDWKAIFEEVNKVQADIVNNTPYRVVHVDRCEADDCIGTIVENVAGREPILIVSPDGDFVQLHKYPNVKQWSNIKKKWVEAKVHPIIDLEEKILKGDKGDGIPNVLSDDDTFINEERQQAMTKGKMKMLMENPEALGTTVARRIIRNRNLIDLSRTPEDIKEEILQQLEKGPKGSIVSLMTLLTKYQMKMMAESLSDFEVRSLAQ